MRFEYSIEGTIGYITLVNPIQNTDIVHIFADKIELSRFLAAPSIKGVIIRGKGAHFYTGAEISAGKSKAVEKKVPNDVQNRIRDLFHQIAFATVPVIASIQGSCLDLGLLVALSSHFRFASDTTLFGFQEPEPSYDITYLLDGTIIAQEALKKEGVTSAIFSGKTVSADKAKELGIVDHLCFGKSIQTEVEEFILSLTEKRSSHLIRAVMQSIHNSRRYPGEKALSKENILFHSIVRNKTFITG